MCTHCNDTGSLSKSIAGYLDCAYCDVATERVQLEQWYRKTIDTHNPLLTAWLAYLQGKDTQQKKE